NPFQADVPWHEYFDFGPEDDDEAVVGNHEAQSLVITPVDKTNSYPKTAAHLAEREENKKRIEEISQRYDVYLSREEPLTDSEPGFSFSESELDPPEEPNWPTESAKLRLDGWEEEPEDRPVVLDERTLQPEVSPSNSTGLDASPASGRLKTSLVTTRTQYWVVTQTSWAAPPPEENGHPSFYWQLARTTGTSQPFQLEMMDTPAHTPHSGVYRIG
ncbi:SubName: Full=Uncharacterized protein {ECO:0000313/EMBL:CCA75996.1}, partial [Serendipita indica DSM 11827]